MRNGKGTAQAPSVPGAAASGTPCFAYTRVSTAKQRDHSVSLEAQREAIEAYARRHGLAIIRWFTESQTAAKRGRAEFAKMLQLLKEGEAEGVIVHKIDRSARNLKDWADFAELSDRGVEVHFAAEALDLASRGGRLSADIQAVVAADYIRNLRQEAVKGIRGRYKQGLFPRQAPAGYQNNGGGKPKTIHPVQGPLVREAFERYATGRYSLDSLVGVMDGRGLRNTHGRPLSKNSLHLILRNPFYTGVIVERRTAEVFQGQHEPLVTRSLFDAVQAVLDGRKHRTKKGLLVYAFRKLLNCALCESTLVPERQRGHVYYRCHTKGCPLKCTREEAVDAAVRFKLERVSLTEAEYERYAAGLVELLVERGARVTAHEQALELEIGKVSERLSRLTDLLLDGVLTEGDYREKKEDLIVRRQGLQEKLARLSEHPGLFEERIRKYLERATRASLSYERAKGLEKRELVETFTSNRVVSPESVVVELRNPFQVLADRPVVSSGPPDRDVPRTDIDLFITTKRIIQKMISELEQLDKRS